MRKRDGEREGKRERERVVRKGMVRGRKDDHRERAWRERGRFLQEIVRQWREI